MKYLIMILSVLLMFPLVGCKKKSSGGGGSGVTLNIDNLVGTYQLVDVYIEYSDGSTFTDEDLGLTGTMKVTDTTISQTFSNGQESFSIFGQWDLIVTGTGQSGIFRITDPSGTHDVAFTIAGNEMQTNSGVIQSTAFPGLTFIELDTWQKTSNVVNSAMYLDDSTQDWSYGESFNK